ncbi:MULTISPECIES: hypothetical protein [unclassified Neorhizobium]|uniref:hypothetical protein n=1 Tax=unclassified Neorhizobium TaxID=2629175 RepID=UPI001FF21E02|nr:MULTISPECIES: hypothetical protein [unclassified Neorhizobium]MCJ9745505.1 hypothetical protein [Neorhizobium sp. SHOUNA12A]
MTELILTVESTQLGGVAPSGAIVTLTALDSVPDQVDPRWAKTAVVDITLKGRPSPHRFEIPVDGWYGISVRYPGGVEQRDQQIVGSTKLEIVVGEPNRLAGPDLVPESTFRSTRYTASNGRGRGPTRVSRTSSSYFLPLLKPTFRAMDDPAVLLPTRVARNEVVRSVSEETSQILLPDYSDLLAVYQSLRGGNDETNRYQRWLLSLGDASAEMISVPWAWEGLSREDRSASILLRQEAVREKGTSRTRLEVRDPKWAGLLRYVSLGRIDDAALVAAQILNNYAIAQHYDEWEEIPALALQGKVKGPLVATLGAIILVSTAEYTSARRWDAWLENLANWFPGIPDGAAVLGYRSLQRGDFEGAARWLKISVERGLPFFSATFRLLSVAFSQLEDDDSIRVISKAVSSVDPTQPFTVLRLR